MEELKKRLDALAYAKSHPFCYGCYVRCPSGRCKKCHSDDLMREVEGVGVEYGTEWVIAHLISTDLNEVDTQEAFENSLEGCYPETTQIGFIEYDTITAMKELDPVCFDMAKSEWIDNELSDDNLIEFNSKYYWKHDLENYLDENEEVSA